MVKPKATELAKIKKNKLEAALPSQISVLGQVFTVKVANLKGISGDCSVHDRVIRIHQNQDIESAKATLWHESLHAALGVAGLAELLDHQMSAHGGTLEEAIVVCLENSFRHAISLDNLAVKNNLTTDAE